jgi:mannosyltransferase
MNLIYDNLIYSLQQAGGISTYWAELSARLIRDEIDVKFIESENINIVRKELNIPNKNILQDRSLPLIINRFLSLPLPKIHNSFIFHSSYNRISGNKNAIQVMTIHDFVHEKFYSGLRQKLHTYQKNMALKNAQLILAVSENTKRDLLEYHPEINEADIKVIYNGVSEDFQMFSDKTEVPLPYLLFIGSREHYKNFTFVVNLLKELPGFHLYIVGRPFTEAESSQLSVLKGRFKLFNNIDNIKLNELYNNAYALLYPSSYEGFGIPLLEAMKCGLPFIALNKSSIPEVAGKSGVLLEALDIDLFRDAVQFIDLNRKILVNKGLEQAKQFSWEKCYQQTVSVYQNLI